jgi:N-succinyldiaminopimelate aminotransferase
LISHKLAPFGTTIFSEMTALAARHGAINLAQGFPDFEGPPGIVDAAVDALRGGHNQYARSMGHPELVAAIADTQRDCYGLDYDPLTEITVFCGATEGIAASLLGLLNPGDEVILFEPFYDSYPACVALAGATARFCTLRFPDFALDSEALAALFTPRTRLLVLNSPHNPTGKVFGSTELEAIARLCQAHGVIVVADEVYEHLTYDGVPHVPIASLPGMRERTLTISSTGKTYSLTGWKVGWAAGPPELVAAAQAAHQFLTFCAATPLQVAMARALRDYGRDYYASLRSEYTVRRDHLSAVLREVGFKVARPAGTYFVLADFSDLWEGDDRSFARHLVETVGVAAIPPSVFYAAAPDAGRHLLRFAFCKRAETLNAAAERLRKLRPAG